MMLEQVELRLKEFLTNASKVALLTVGNILNSDDGVGHAIFRDHLQDIKPDDGWFVRDVELMPENFLAPLRRWGPSHLLLVDAIQVGAQPGEVLLFSKEEIIGGSNQLSTHSLPLSSFITELERETSSIKVLGVGVQVQTSEFGVEALSPPVYSTAHALGKLLAQLIMQHQLEVSN